ncbi:hypothetical protein ACFOEY_20185 [Paracandidimonas soli]
MHGSSAATSRTRFKGTGMIFTARLAVALARHGRLLTSRRT